MFPICRTALVKHRGYPCSPRLGNSALLHTYGWLNPRNSFPPPPQPSLPPHCICKTSAHMWSRTLARTRDAHVYAGTRTHTRPQAHRARRHGSAHVAHTRHCVTRPYVCKRSYFRPPHTPTYLCFRNPCQHTFSANVLTNEYCLC